MRPIREPDPDSANDSGTADLLVGCVDGGLALSPKMVQERLGHYSITMTMDTYGRLFPSTDDAEALAAAERRLLMSVNAT